MDSARLQFDLDLEVRGFELVEQAAARGRGFLTAGTHAHAGLARLILRRLDDANVRTAVVSTASAFPICGTGRTAPTINPSGSFLVNVRARFREGFAVCAMLDTVDADGRIVVRDTLRLVAARWDVPAVVIHAKLEGHRVVIKVANAD
jgi:hypothetical protein